MSAEALESLLEHPGWRLFWLHVQDEWGPTGKHYRAELDKALDLMDNDAAASQARQIRSAQKVIAGIMNWPKEECARLKRAEMTSEKTESRRGSL